MSREVVLDTETTGMDPHSGHRIVEIGCVELKNGMRTGHHFHCYLNPERDMPAEAERVHGLSLDFLLDKPLFAEKVDEFLEFIEDSPLVIHNAGFDMRFLNAELDRCGFPVMPMERAIDTVLIARKKFPGAPANLDALCRRFDIDLSARTKHGALLDAELLSDVYIELLGGRQVKLELEAEEADKQASRIEIQRERLEPRIFELSEEEKQAHAKMLEKLKEPLWSE
ncbi:MAG: DNA polymerase III subunit epsilon [Rickettsiales bacterium]